MLARIASTIALLFVTATSRAQETTGQIRGTVTDQTGGVFAGVSVELANPAARTWTVVTDRQGRYLFSNIGPGSFVVSVAIPGFLPYMAEVIVRPDQPVTHDITVKLGVSVAVEVREQAGLSNDPRRNLSSLILTGKEIEALPDNPRLFLLRMAALAGSTGRPGDVAIYVDGFREYKRLPPKDTIEMIRVNSNPFSAEFSQPSTRRIEISTKPGSDRLHGGGTLQVRSSRLDARSPLAATKPQTEYRNYTGYLQGPLRRDRVGFVLYGGHWHQDENAVINATVLDAASGALHPFAATVRTPSGVTSGMGKVDFTLFNQVTSVSHSRTNEIHRNQGLDSGFDLPERAYARRSHDDVTRVSMATFGRRGINDIRVEFTRGAASLDPFSSAPAVLVLDAFNAGGNQSALSRTTTIGLQATETLAIQTGAHTLKVGGQIERMRQHTIDRTGFGGTFTFGAGVERDATGAPSLNAAGQPVFISPIENYRRAVLLLPGYGPSQFSIATGDPAVTLSQWELGWFVLDDWYLSKTLTLSYGLRHELQTNAAGKMNLAPRASLSWLLNESGQTALKIGAGIFYARVDPAVTLDTLKHDGGQRRDFTYEEPGFLIIPPALEATSPVPSTTYIKDENLRVPYSLVTTFAYERQLPRGLFAVAQYLHSKGFRQLRLREASGRSRSSPGGGSAPILQFESTGRATHQELMLGLRGTIGGMSLYGNYQLGRKQTDTDGAYTTPADSAALASEHGAAADDRRHQLVLGANTPLPWGLTFDPSIVVASGQPFNITTGSDNNRDTLFSDRPAFAFAGDPDGVYTAFGVFNPHPASGDTIIPRNYGREPWQIGADMALSRDLFSGLHFTIDVQNLFNNSRLAGLNGVVTSPVFGKANRTLGARRVELTVRYSF